jgi:N-acetyl-anhydromuramyl-L-alanine amidase AmpD
VDSVARLTVDLVQTFDVPIQRIIGHEDVATPLGHRKFDPGPLWNWKKFIPDVCGRLGISVPNDVWKLHKTVD